MFRIKHRINNILGKNNSVQQFEQEDMSFLPLSAKENSGWYNHYKSIKANILKFQQLELFSKVDYEGKTVLDFGGSAGQFAVALLELGASSATVIDTSLPLDIYKKTLKSIKNLKAFNMTIEKLAEIQPASVDFVVAHTVTEHIDDLPSVFTAIKKIMKPGAVFFIAHDNYYHASGAHDNIMLQIGENGLYEYLGPKCWKTKERCSVSLSWRQNMREKMPWVWSDGNESSLKPEACEKCSFFKRTHPWSHLLWQNEFLNIFREPAFTSGREGSILNKVTPFQLTQYIVEAGFQIELSKRLFINNEPPKELLEDPLYYTLKALNEYGHCSKYLDNNVKAELYPTCPQFWDK